MAPQATHPVGSHPRSCLALGFVSRPGCMAGRDQYPAVVAARFRWQSPRRYPSGELEAMADRGASGLACRRVPSSIEQERLWWPLLGRAPGSAGPSGSYPCSSAYRLLLLVRSSLACARPPFQQHEKLNSGARQRSCPRFQGVEDRWEARANRILVVRTDPRLRYRDKGPPRCEARDPKNREQV